MTTIFVHHAGTETLDLLTVYDGVIRASPDWYNFGLALGLHNEDLRAIKMQLHEGHATHYLREMLALRLRLGSLTWMDVIIALISPTVERYDVAEELQEKLLTSEYY